MHSRPGDPRSLHVRLSARELLGSAHPLARVEGQLSVVVTRSIVVAALLCAGVAALVEDLSVGLSLTVVAAVTEAALAARAMLLAEIRREHALDLIIEGRGDLPIGVVARQRRRLLDPARRHRLASALEEIRDEALRPPQRYTRLRPIFDPRVIAAVAPELTTIARLLRADPRLSALAMAQRLVTNGGSPLYRSDLRLLRDELHRLEHHLKR
jgi:hypothetical protein